MDQSDPKNYKESEELFFSEIENHFTNSSGTFTDKAHAFPRFLPRQAISYFLARDMIFREILNVHGSILDFGLYRGSSFFTWQQLSAIYEPYNHIRKVIGFDSFQGFSSFGEHDKSKENNDLSIRKKGGMAYDGEREIQKSIDLFNLNRPIGHVEKGGVVEGELPKSCKTYLDDHPEIIVSLANFGLGLYEPTVELLKLIKPRLIKGSVVVMEDLNQSTWPGETKALMEVFELDEILIKRVPYCPHISWFQIGGV